MAEKHFLPSKLPSYLRRLDLEYVRAGRNLEHQIVQSAKITVLEETSYDNWNGGTYGHDLIVFLPEEVLKTIPFAEQATIAATLRDELNNCASAIQNEHVENVILELADDGDFTYQMASPLSRQPQINPDTVAFWKQGHVRLFVSHRDTHKIQARALANSLEQYGVSAFVAHDTIIPMSTWQREIEKGLDTMEMMLAFITDDFHASPWTNQEIGFAIGKRIPIISVKFGSRDPVGFIGDKQAMRGRIDQPEETAKNVLTLIMDSLGQKLRVQQVLIAAFLASPDWDAARDRFNRMSSAVSTLSEDELQEIATGFAKNDQLYRSIYLTNQNRRLERFLEKTTGKVVTVRDRKIAVQTADMDDEIPF